jgi:mannonate dehydratase
MDQIVLAKPGRDKQIEIYKQCIRNMGKVGIPVLCYNFMPWRFVLKKQQLIKIASLRVARTSYEIPIRGGALSSGFNFNEYDDSLRTEDGEVLFIIVNI